MKNILIKKYSEFILENMDNGNEFSYIDTEKGEICININKLKEIFSFVGEGIYEIDLQSNIGKGNMGKKHISYNSNFIYITFIEDASGLISISTWKKVETILDALKEKNGFCDYNINASHNELTLEFDQEYPIVSY